MTEHGVDAVLTGRLGPKARAALEASGVGMYEGLGRSTVAEALEQFRAGQYGASGQAQEQTTAGTASASPAQCKGPGAVRVQGGGQGKGNCGCGNGTGKGQGRRRGQ